jgi:hypothetical protein
LIKGILTKKHPQKETDEELRPEKPKIITIKSGISRESTKCEEKPPLNMNRKIIILKPSRITKINSHSRENIRASSKVKIKTRKIEQEKFFSPIPKSNSNFNTLSIRDYED